MALAGSVPGTNSSQPTASVAVSDTAAGPTLGKLHQALPEALPEFPWLCQCRNAAPRGSQSELGALGAAAGIFSSGFPGEKDSPAGCQLCYCPSWPQAEPEMGITGIKVWNFVSFLRERAKLRGVL